MSIADKTIVLTRRPEQSASITDALTAKGAQVICFPTIQLTAPPDETVICRALVELDSFDWIIFTSANAVERFFTYIRPSNKEGHPRIAVVGPATLEALEAHSVQADLMAENYQAEGLVATFEDLESREQGRKAGRVLIPRALEAREILPEELLRLGYEVTVAPVYQTVQAFPGPAALSQLERADGIIFTSPSTARNFTALLEEEGRDALSYLSGRTVFSIGPITTDELEHLGISRSRIRQADEATGASLVDTITRSF